MQHLIGDLFNSDTYRWPITGHHAGFIPDAICITVNGFLKKNHRAVMGRGCAKRACELFPGLDAIWGSLISSHGNHVQWYTQNGSNLVFFPVKPVSEVCWHDKSNVVKHMQERFRHGQIVPGWACKADLEIIEHSARELVSITSQQNWLKIVFPRPGCGCGELSWQDEVKPLLEGILDDRFYSITFG